MLNKFVNLIKYFSITAGLLIAVISCEKDFTNVGVNIVDNNVFTTDKYVVSNIKAYNQNIEKNQTNNLSYYLLGTYEDPNFGRLTGSVISQLSMPEGEYNYGNNPVIDSIILNIPLDATREGNVDVEDLTVPEFSLDSIWASGSNHSFNLRILRLETFLNYLDPSDPTKSNKFYSDEDFSTSDLLFEGVITPNPTDTMSIIKRRRFNDISLDLNNRTVYSIDTIKNQLSEPSIKITLDEEYFKQNFQDVSNTVDFSTNADFRHYFKGLYFDVSDLPDGDVLLALQFAKANITIYYSETEFLDENDDEDNLNNNGINGEQDVPVGTAKSFTFPLNGITVNKFEREYSGYTVESYLNTPSPILGSDKLFIQGAAGSDGIIHLFGDDANSNNIPDELETLRENEWLINDAQLILSIDPSNSTNAIPERLYIYTIDENGDKLQIEDARKLGSSAISGTLVKDDDENPLYYKFHITKYISEILHNDSEIPVRDLGIKTYMNNDDILSLTDTIMRDYNNNHKNVIITGNLSTDTEKKIRLDIYYTKKND